MADDPLRPMVLTTVETESQAAMIVSALGERGIQARSIGGLSSGFRAEAPGGVKVLVRQIDFEQAQAALQAIAATHSANDEA
jgi:hypothetical protein